MTISGLDAESAHVGLVLSGGGVRGAYEVGVVQGIVEVLGCEPEDGSPFDIVSGTSVGAINAVWVGGWADRGDLNIDGLATEWTDLELSTHLRLDWRGTASILGGSRLRRILTDTFSGHGASFLDVEPFEAIVEQRVPWRRLHENVESHNIEAVAVAALEVSTGRTFVFGETSDAVSLGSVQDGHRRFTPCSLDADHVLASAAIPLLFPAREIDYDLFCDGGLRLNTPIPPAIRTGADRLVVISVGDEDQFPESEGEWARAARRSSFANPVFIAGKALNALLVDPVYREIQITERVNRMVGAVEEVLDDEQLEQFHETVEASRGSRYRRIPTLSFNPSESVSELARSYAQEVDAKHPSTRMILRLASSSETVERDLLSFILFDGTFARALIELGREDALARAGEIEEFFADGE